MLVERKALVKLTRSMVLGLQYVVRPIGLWSYGWSMVLGEVTGVRPIGLWSKHGCHSHKPAAAGVCSLLAS